MKIMCSDQFILSKKKKLKACVYRFEIALKSRENLITVKYLGKIQITLHSVYWHTADVSTTMQPLMTLLKRNNVHIRTMNGHEFFLLTLTVDLVLNGRIIRC